MLSPGRCGTAIKSMLRDGTERTGSHGIEGYGAPRTVRSRIGSYVASGRGMPRCVERYNGSRGDIRLIGSIA